MNIKDMSISWSCEPIDIQEVYGVSVLIYMYLPII